MILTARLKTNPIGRLLGWIGQGLETLTVEYREDERRLVCVDCRAVVNDKGLADQLLMAQLKEWSVLD